MERAQVYEPLLAPDMARFCLFPIKYPKLFAFYQRAVQGFWTAEEIDMSADGADFEKLSDNEQLFISMTLAFFAASDGIVQENLAGNFLNEVQVAEARMFYSYQIFNEAVHSQTYSLLIDAIVKDIEHKDRLFSAIERVPAVAEKAKWAMKWLNPAHAFFAERLVAFACVELIQFSGSFAAIFWLKQRHPGKMPGLTTSNEFISRDEGQHGMFAVELYRDHIVQKLDSKRIHEIISEAVTIEKKFVTDSLPVSLLGMSDKQMQQYIEFVANKLCVDLGAPALFKDTQNPFPFMTQLSLPGKTNFFEKRVSEYRRATGPTNEFRIEEDF